MPRRTVPTITEIASALGDDTRTQVHEQLDRSVRGLTARRDEVLAEAQEVAASYDERIQVLTVARDTFRDGPQKPHKKRQRRGAHNDRLDPEKLAGKTNVLLVEGTLARLGKATQHELVLETGKNSGTITHSLRALKSRGAVKPTGRKERGSAEWEYVAPRASHAGNGRRVA